MKLSALIFNTVWSFFCQKKWEDFEKSSHNVYLTQEKMLKSILKKNQNTIYGKRYGFKSIRSMEDFQLRVPVTEYEDYQHYIEEIRIGRTNVISSDHINSFVLTSGTANFSKWIPYNSTLIEEFGRPFEAWLYNLFINFPKVKSGTFHWFISPNLNNSKYDSILPVGFNEGAKYSKLFEKYFINTVLSVPLIVSTIKDYNAFKYVSLLFLLSDYELRFISIRNPKSLKSLLDFSFEKKESLISDIEKGTISIPLERDLERKLLSKFKGNKKRANQLREIFLNEDFSWEKVWPNLIVISLWVDGKANLFLPDIKKNFPKVSIQGKGLMSTEGIVSIPISSTIFSGNVLALTSHFFEFKDVSSNKIILSHELKVDSIYEVILTTGGGLYRYATKDRIKVMGMFNDTPSLNFIGKDETVSDLVGEKLSEIHLYNVLNSAFKKFKITPEFYYVQPNILENGTNYILFLETLSSYDKDSLGSYIDTSLEDNIQYGYYRKTNQLSCFEVKAIPSDPMKEYLERKTHKNSIGVVKHSLFQNRNK